jgi:peroxiredoxin Q/BCP
MAQLRLEHELLIAQDAEVIVVGPESSTDFQAYWKKHDLPFIGLPNPDHSVLKRFGQEVNLFKLGRMPAQVIIDKNGIVRYVHYGKSMADIPTNQDIMEILSELNTMTEPVPV